jgi:hypothetical protein
VPILRIERVETIPTGDFGKVVDDQVVVIIKIHVMRKLSMLIVLFFGLASFVGSDQKESKSLQEPLYPRGITVYEHASFNKVDGRGASLEIECTEFNFGNKGWGDAISSIYIPQGEGWKVVVYEHAKFGGQKRTFTESVPDLDAHGFNDVVSSIRIYKNNKLQPACVWTRG